MRMRVVTILAAGAMLAGPVATSSAAPKYRVCDNTKKSPYVTTAKGLSCKAAKSETRSLVRKQRTAGQVSSVRGWKVGTPRSGRYFGLEGTRTVLSKGSDRIRYYSRGE